MSSYQAQALRTEAPMTLDVFGRFTAVENLLLARLQYVYQVIFDLKLDALKKFIFYGKKMDDYPEVYHASANTLPEGVDEQAMRDSESYIRYLHGLLGEITETEEKLKALIEFRTTGVWDKVNLLEEEGDGLWYTALRTDALGGLMGDTAKANIQKLRKRYPDKFTEKHANERDLDAERKSLETDLTSNYLNKVNTTPNPADIHGIDHETA